MPGKTDDQRREEAIRNACTRFLMGHGRVRPHDVLADLSAFTDPEAQLDYYGAGDLIAGFEAEVADLLGKPAAVFMPSGTMAQQIALRIWADRSGNRAVAFHPTCHLELHEQQAYRLLHDLHGVLVGDRFRLMTLGDLQAIQEPVGALLIELPQRHIGGALPTWDELTAIVGWARERGIILHMDGARLWECQPYYGRDLAAIAELFDTVYVSCYKTLGGITGAVLAGPEDVIAEARVWQRRHGGNLIHLYPYVLSAQKGLQERLPLMTAYHEKAVAIAAALEALPGVAVTPHPPQTHMMHIYLQAKQERLRESALALAEETGIWFLREPSLAQVPGTCWFELSVGDATLEIPTEEIADLIAAWVTRSRA